MIFQSTHQRGVRPATAKIPQKLLYFNPRTHVGCDSLGGDVCALLAISIHAPTWGATGYMSSFTNGVEKFQSTHPRGVRHARAGVQVSQALFQSTHPRGVRRRANDMKNKFENFNPRTHVGCDNRSNFRYHTARYFNPRTHVGCDFILKTILIVKIYFNPRTHVGCDSKMIFVTLTFNISIHAPTWGATVKPSNGWLLGHKDNEFANENIIIINSVNIT